MKRLSTLYPAFLVLLPVAALWIWFDGGMWANGALPTHGLLHVLAGCGAALLLRIVNRRR